MSALFGYLLSVIASGVCVCMLGGGGIVCGKGKVERVECLSGWDGKFYCDCSLNVGLGLWLL